MAEADGGQRDQKGSLSQTATEPSKSQPQLSEEDRKALEGIATAIGIPQIAAQVTKLTEQVNLIMTKLGGTTTLSASPGVTGISSGTGMRAMIEPLIKELAAGIPAAIAYFTGGGGQPSGQISGIDKEIMEEAIRKTVEVKEKVGKANEALTRLYMGGGEVLTDGEGNVLIKRGKVIDVEKVEKK